MNAEKQNCFQTMKRATYTYQCDTIYQSVSVMRFTCQAASTQMSSFQIVEKFFLIAVQNGVVRVCVLKFCPNGIIWL